jgi:3-hydroxy acid dehydrogenase / malonic semialdehyde reductase
MKNSKFAYITGATSGFGRAIASNLASLGYSLFITGRREPKLLELKTELEKQFKIEVIPLPQHKSKLEQLAVIVNNAGLAVGVDPIQTGDPKNWDIMLDTNVKGLLYTTHLLLPYLIKQGQGDIVNIGSVAGRWSYPGGNIYSATKFAVRSLSEGMRFDLIGKNIRVMNIEPGMAETEFSQVRFNQDLQKAKSVYQGMTPLNAQDIAETVAWCLTRPRHVNIQELVIFPTDQASVTHVHRS